MPAIVAPRSTKSFDKKNYHRKKKGIMRSIVADGEMASRSMGKFSDYRRCKKTKFKNFLSMESRQPSEEESLGASVIAEAKAFHVLPLRK